MQTRTFSSHTSINKPIEKVFEFFSKAENLNLLTPPHLQFHILTPLPIAMKANTIIDYKLKLYGLSFLWKTQITSWNPPYNFTDAQIKGPYLRWNHEHLFQSQGENTLMIDKVEYMVPGWFLEPIIHELFVKRNIEKIFRYRSKSIAEIFNEHRD